MRFANSGRHFGTVNAPDHGARHTGDMDHGCTQGQALYSST